MKKSDSPSRQQNAHLHDIPDIDIIDLENDGDNLSDTNGAFKMKDLDADAKSAIIDEILAFFEGYAVF